MYIMFNVFPYEKLLRRIATAHLTVLELMIYKYNLVISNLYQCEIEPSNCSISLYNFYHISKENFYPYTIILHEFSVILHQL